MGELAPAQRRAVAHEGGPLLLRGGPGTGKTRVLLERFCRLAAAGEGPERILVLVPTPAAADGARRALEDALPGPYEELAVHTPASLGAELVVPASADPFGVTVSRADRLAMLQERLDELTLRVHDLGGDPAAVLASFVRRIDVLKAAGVTAAEHATWAAALPAEDEAERHRARLAREFAAVWTAHERMLAEAGALDRGEAVLRAVRLLREAPHVARRARERWHHVLVDDVPDLSWAELELLRELARPHGNLLAAGDEDGAFARARGAAGKNLAELRRAFPQAEEIALEDSARCGAEVLRAAEAVVAPARDSARRPTRGAPGGEVAFWRCANERAQAQAVAADVERLVAREGVAPKDIAVLVRSAEREGPAVAVALEERDLTHRLLGTGAFFARAEIRDVLAWLRLLRDAGDAGAVVRALARPPIELRSADLARCTQIARRRKLDMVAGLAAACESPQIPPEARERILLFRKTHRALAADFETARPDLFVHRLIDRLGFRRQLVFSAAPEIGERLRNLSRLGELAAAYVLREPQATARDFAGYVAAVAEAGGRGGGVRRAAGRVGGIDVV